MSVHPVDRRSGSKAFHGLRPVAMCWLLLRRSRFVTSLRDAPRYRYMLWSLRCLRPGVNTAIGEKYKPLEFNVRLKTDSSRDGPSPEKPVMNASGMRGNRVFLVRKHAMALSDFLL